MGVTGPQLCGSLAVPPSALVLVRVWVLVLVQIRFAGGFQDGVATIRRGSLDRLMGGGLKGRMDDHLEPARSR